MKLEPLILIQYCEHLLRQGQIAAVQQRLKKISSAEIPRGYTADLASMARRAHLWKLSLRWLYSIVRPKIKTDKGPSPREVIEYALALQKAGALNEAHQLLSQVDFVAEPRALLSMAYIHMASWDYPAAKILILRYLQSKNLTTYETLVARVNLLAALVFLKDERAESILPELEAELIQGEYKLLLSNCLEISAQYFASKAGWAEATAALVRAEKLVGQEKYLDALFVKKWKAIVTALKNNNPAPLTEFRPLALSEGHWETLRDLDFYQAVLQPEGFWGNWVYYGTPHSQFRKRMESLRDFPMEQWIQRSPKTTVKIDPWFPKDHEAALSHRCYVLLLRDLYRPLRVGEIFGALFPDEFYNPESSPNRVHQTITRMSKWLTDLSLPFHLHENEGAYSLRIEENIQLLGRRQILQFDECHFTFDRYQSKLPPEFTADDIAQVIGLPKSNLHRMIKTATEQNVLIKLGQGRYTTYCFSMSR